MTESTDNPRANVPTNVIKAKGTEIVDELVRRLRDEEACRRLNASSIEELKSLFRN